MRVTTFVEAKPKIETVKWLGYWGEAHDFAALWPKAKGFGVIGETLFIHFDEAALGLQIVRGTYVQVKTGLLDGRQEAVGLLTREDLQGYVVQEVR